jgi:hypothetical protein
VAMEGRRKRPEKDGLGAGLFFFRCCERRE